MQRLTLIPLPFCHKRFSLWFISATWFKNTSLLILFTLYYLCSISALRVKVFLAVGVFHSFLHASLGLLLFLLLLSEAHDLFVLFVQHIYSGIILGL